MSQKAVSSVLQELYNFENGIMEMDLKTKVLSYFKEKRKGLTKEEVINQGYHVYEKRGISFNSLLEELLTKGFVESSSYENEPRKISLSPIGLNYLLSILTDAYSEAYIAYQESVNNLAESRNETFLDPVHIAGMYYNHKSLADVQDLYFSDKTYSNLKGQVRDYHEHLLSLQEMKANENDLFLQVVPKLFLPLDDMHEKVSLSVEGLTLPSRLELDRPFPNQRYVVAGAKIGREKISTGFHIVIGTKEDPLNEKKFSYHWKLGNGKEIIHNLHILFQLDRGNLFSTEQTLNRSNNLPTILLTTYIENSYLTNQNRQMEYIHVDENVVIINEKVILSSFPMQLHSMFWAHTSFNKWRKKQ